VGRAFSLRRASSPLHRKALMAALRVFLKIVGLKPAAR